jgi:hypothetical protein
MFIHLLTLCWDHIVYVFMRPEIGCWYFVIHTLWYFGCIWDIWDVVFIPLRVLWKLNYAYFKKMMTWHLELFWLINLFAVIITFGVQGCYTNLLEVINANSVKFRQTSFHVFYTMLWLECRVRCFNIELAENRQIKANITDIEF